MLGQIDITLVAVVALALISLVAILVCLSTFRQSLQMARQIKLAQIATEASQSVSPTLGPAILNQLKTPADDSRQRREMERAAMEAGLANPRPINGRYDPLGSPPSPGFTIRETRRPANVPAPGQRASVSEEIADE